MDLTASAIKPGRRSLNRASMDVRRARGAIKDPSHTKSRDVALLVVALCMRAMRFIMHLVLLAPTCVAVSR